MKNNKSWKSFAAGMLTMAILVALCVPVLGVGNLQTLEDVLVGGVRIVIDGQELHPTDVNGNPVEPMIYNGTTYLPVRAVASAMGKAVSWDGPTFTAYIGDMDGQLEYPTVMLKDMLSIADRVAEVGQALTDNYGARYSSAIYNGNGNTYMEFLLNMKYSHFKGTLYIPEGQTDGGSRYLTVEADGRTLYTSPALDKTSRPVPVDVNVTGYNDVKVIFSDCNKNAINNPTLTLCLADAGFYQ